MRGDTEWGLAASPTKGNQSSVWASLGKLKASGAEGGVLWSRSFRNKDSVFTTENSLERAEATWQAWRGGLVLWLLAGCQGQQGLGAIRIGACGSRGAPDKHRNVLSAHFSLSSL